MAPNPKIKKACDAMKLFGVPEAKVKLVLKNLLKTYDSKWDFIEDEDYKVLIDAVFDEADAQATDMKKKEEKEEAKDVSTTRGKKKAPEQTQPLVNDEEDEMDEDEIPLKRRLRRKRGRGCDNNTSLTTGSPISQKPNKETSKTQPEEEDEDDNMTELPPLKRYFRRSGERGMSMTLYNNASPSFSSRMSMEPEELPPILLLPAVPIQDEKDSEDGALIILNDEPNTDHKPVILDTGNCSAPMLEIEKSNMHVEEWDRETEDILNDTTTMDVPPSAIGESSEHKVAAASVELASSTSGEAKICLTYAPATGETTNLCFPSVEDFRRAMEENCLKSYKIVHPEFSVLGSMKDLCSCYIDLAKNSTNQSLETETVRDMSKAGDESGAAGISMGLVVVPECEISADGWRAINNVKDITVGEENVEIPWVNEINDEVPSHFRYIPQSFVFQDAPVKFSLSSFSDEQSCSSSCIEDCLASAMPCNCAIAVDNGFAYTADGVIKEDFLEARISEARDQRKQVFFTPNGKGWGLRTLEKLPKGAFICEHIGEILTIPELYQRSFEDKLSCPVMLDAHWGSEEWLEDDKALCLDGTCYGNIARFLNHRCLDANLIEIPVYVETPDQHYYHLAFFTTRDIEAMEELTWDYGIDFNDDDSLMKPFDCLCGSRFCRTMKRSKKTKQIMNRA